MVPAGSPVAERMKCYLNRGSIDPQLDRFLSGLAACDPDGWKVAIEPCGGAPDGLLRNADVSKSETGIVSSHNADRTNASARTQSQWAMNVQTAEGAIIPSALGYTVGFKP